jgi:predicted acetyltransferase
MVKINFFHKIIINGKEVGYIQLVHSDSMPQIPQIEYDLDEEYWGKGIMTRELIQYIEAIRSEFKSLVAVVKRKNLASKRVLDKCGFIFMTKSGNYDIFINDLQANSEKKKIMKELVENGYVKKIKRQINRINIGSDNVKNFI